MPSPSVHPHRLETSIAMLESVDLVTFDCFGTLVDWRSALPALGCDMDRLPVFMQESKRRQRPGRRDAKFLAYRSLLEEIGAVLRPDKPIEEIAAWARGFGDLPFFDDAIPAIRLLADTVAIGVVSNCDALHQLDVSRRLGRPWDIVAIADELGAYKPTDRAWDGAVAIVEKRGFDRARWLHVSAWDDYDLAPAAARGIQTAYVPRPGGVPPTNHAVDHVFGDLLALATAVARARGGPVVYEVDATASSADALARYVDWLTTEHLADVRACAGVRSASLTITDETRARATYVFATRAAFQRYVERDAPKLRDKSAALFGDGTIKFERRDGTIVASR